VCGHSHYAIEKKQEFFLFLFLRNVNVAVISGEYREFLEEAILPHVPPP